MADPWCAPGEPGKARMAAARRTAIALSVLLLSFTGTAKVLGHPSHPSTVVLTVAPLAVSTVVPVQPPPQNLPPGAIKTPGSKCATVIQPPDGQGCPGRPGDTAYCTGSPYNIGACEAAEAGFFDPTANFQPRNGVEACINEREHGGLYDRSANPSHFGRWQFSVSLWRSAGGQADWGNAPPGEQDMLFVRVVDAGGIGNWTRYDGC